MYTNTCCAIRMCVGGKEREEEKQRTTKKNRDRLKRLNFKEGNLQKQNKTTISPSTTINTS